MKKLYYILKLALWAVIGGFIGSSVYRYYDYKTHPNLYAVQSAPWYLSIQISAVFAALIVTVILIGMWVIRRFLKAAD